MTNSTYHCCLLLSFTAITIVILIDLPPRVAVEAGSIVNVTSTDGIGNCIGNSDETTAQISSVPLNSSKVLMVGGSKLNV